MRADEERVRDALVAAGLGARLASLLEHIQIETWLTTQAGETGASLLGGAPELPEDFEWPVHRWTRAEIEGWPDYARAEIESALAAGHVSEEEFAGVGHVAMPIPFVAQIEIADVRPHDRWPQGGTLWFFAEQGTFLGNEFGPPHVASAVLFDPASGSKRSVRRPPPMPAAWSLPRAVLVPERRAVLPLEEEIDELALRGALTDLSMDERNALAAVSETLRQRSPRHALAAAPDHGAAGQAPPPGWTMLLRIDSDDTLRGGLVNWGDGAWITFGLPDPDFDARRFESARAFLWIG